MIEPLYDAIVGYVEAGGFVMPPLIGGALVLWYAIGYRYVTLQRGSHRHIRSLVKNYRKDLSRKPRGLIDQAARLGVVVAQTYPKHVREVLDNSFFPFYQQVKRGRTVIMGIVTVAPLVGLLGTVAGMIETFDSLGDMTLFSQTGGIAGGISQALFSTQMGLCVAIPGVIVGRLLDRRQRQFEEELDQMKALLGGTAA